MDNFQLYRTNIELSGQVKWDLILESAGENLVVKKFLLSPISDTLNYCKYTDDDILKYTHQDNIKKLYTYLGDSFFDPYTDPILDSDYPIVTDEECINSHIGDFEMGCRRNKTYKIHNKQYYFLCPVWLEKLKTDETIVFEISAYSNNKKISSKTVSFNNTYATSLDEEYHNKFVKYFQNYMAYVNINSGNNNLLNFDFNNKNIIISGLDVAAGEFVKSEELPDMYIDFIHRERSLIESDSELLSILKQKKIIAPQLLNIALYFSPEDILPIMFLKDLKGKFVTYKVTASIGTPTENKYNDLELKDFYSNYEYIPRKYCGPADSNYKTDAEKINLNISQPNVLSYMFDFKHVDLVTKNKMLQRIFHWSLAENNDYIFNLYPGFRGFYLENGNISHLNNSLYMDTPDITSEKFSASLNNIGWCNWVNITDPYQLVSNVEKYRKLTSNFKYEWIHNVYYNPTIKKINLRTIYESSYNILDLMDDNLNVLLVRNNSNKDIVIDYNELDNFGLTDRLALYNCRINNKTLQFLLYNHSGVWQDNTGDYDDSLSTTSGNLSNYTLFIVSRHDDLLTFRSIFNSLKGKQGLSIYNEDVDGYSGIDINIKSEGLIKALRKDIENELDILFGANIKEHVKQQYPDNKLYKSNLLHFIQVLYATLYSPDFENIPLVSIENSLYITRAIGPSLASSEIIYMKHNKKGPNLYRYGGKIKPTFIGKDDEKTNYLYYKDYLSDKEELDELNIPIKSQWSKSIYSKFNNIVCGYTFPSIGYCAIKPVEKWDYENVPNTLDYKPLISDIEYNWYNNGIHITLIPSLNIELQSKIINGEYVKIQELVKEYIGTYYNISGKLLDYVFSLYEYESSFDYKDIKDITNYTYKIKLTLI